MSNALETIHLSKRYGRTWALQDCTMALPAGRVAALVGPNGAGKTTLLHLSVGLLEPTAGSAQIFGCSPLKQTTETLPRLGFVAQDHPLYKDFTVANLLTLGRKLNPRWDDTLALARMQKLSIPLNRPASKLSGGQQAQVALVLALAKRPDLMLLDEPLASLDPLAFDFSGPVLIASTVLALALGIFAGTLTRRTVFAIFLTLVLILAIRLPVEFGLRPNYEPRITVTWPLAQNDRPPITLGKDDWNLGQGWIDAHGNKTNNVSCNGPQQTPLQCMQADGYRGNYLSYQPADRFWTFQWIETSIYLAISVLALGATVWLVRRRLV